MVLENAGRTVDVGGFKDSLGSAMDANIAHAAVRIHWENS